MIVRKYRLTIKNSPVLRGYFEGLADLFSWFIDDNLRQRYFDIISI